MGNSIRYYEASLEKACEDDELELVQKYISKLEVKKIDIDIILNRCLEISCRNGSLKTVIWLSSLPNVYIDLATLDIILHNNYFEIFLILVNRSIIEVNNLLFERSCKYNVQITKWIYTVKDEINIHNNKAFLNACLNNKIAIIKFFLENGFNLENNDDYIFKQACKYCRESILDFLCNKCPRYEYIINGRIKQPIIKDKVTYLIENKKWYEFINFLQIKQTNKFKSKECIISFDKSNLITNCGHHYDLRRLCDWYLKKNLCPVCSTKINFSECVINKKFVDYIHENYNQQ